MSEEWSLPYVDEELLQKKNLQPLSFLLCNISFSATSMTSGDSTLSVYMECKVESSKYRLRVKRGNKRLTDLQEEMRSYVGIVQLSLWKDPVSLRQNKN